MNWLIIAVAVVGVFFVVLIWCCLKVASDADDQIEKYWRARK